MSNVRPENENVYPEIVTTTDKQIYIKLGHIFKLSVKLGEKADLSRYDTPESSVEIDSITTSVAIDYYRKQKIVSTRDNNYNNVNLSNKLGNVKLNIEK